MDICKRDLTIYEKIEQKSGTVHSRRCINGRITGSNNCVGYCQYSGHSGFLTSDLREKHRCIEKECFYYIDKDRTREVNKTNYDVFANCLINEARQCIKAYEGLKVLHAIPKEQDTWILRYIAISNDYPIRLIEEQISEKTGYVVRLERLNYNFDVCVKLLLAV